MAVYEYAGVNAAGKKIRGVQDADNPRALRDLLRAQGVFVTDVVEGRAADQRRAGEVRVRMPGAGRVSLMDVSILTRQLATLQKAGVPLVESLTALADQTEKETLKRVIGDVRQRVSEGSALNVALQQHPDVFSDLFVNMVRAGETSGNLDTVLLRLTEFLDDQVTLQQKLTAAMVYPALMVVLGSGIVTYLMVSVIPKVTAIFADQEAALPLVTVILITISHFLGNFWWLCIGLIVGGVTGFRHWVSTKAGRESWDRFILKVPEFGPLARMIAVSRFSKTLATLLSSGVPLLSAMDIVKNILGNTVLIEVIEKARANIREGESIAVPLKRSGQFPPMVTHMIAIGERTGELENMLANVAEAYDRQVSSRIQALTSLLEPLMIVVMGGAVGFIVFAILLPILRMSQTLSQ
jgi:general secretion pathway protein F